MFKLIFKFITITLFLIFSIIGLIVWQGGEPFRVFGEGTIIMGHKFIEFGDFVDELVKDSKEVKKTYEEIKDTVDSVKED